MLKAVRSLVLPLLLTFAGCSSSITPATKPLADSSSTATAAVGSGSSEFSSTANGRAQATQQTIPVPSVASGHSATGAHHDQHAEGTPALEALKLLIEGNERFVADKRQYPAQDKTFCKSLATGQKPEAIILSCSDSRVPPELLFDRGFGDLFVVRTAGEVADATALASIEYAIEHLGSRLIVVMGHSSCGAVNAALSTPAGTSAGSNNLDILVGHIRPNLRAFTAKSIKEDPTIRMPVKANVDGVAASLSLRSKIIREAIATHGVKVVHALYNLDSGKVDFWF